jgi:hypothetical protein
VHGILCTIGSGPGRAVFSGAARPSNPSELLALNDIPIRLEVEDRRAAAIVEATSPGLRATKQLLVSLDDGTLKRTPECQHLIHLIPTGK